MISFSQIRAEAAEKEKLDETLNTEIADLNQKLKMESIRAEAAEKRAEAAENSKSCDEDKDDGKSLRERKVRTDAFLIESHFNMTAGSNNDDGDSSNHGNLKPSAKRDAESDDAHGTAAPPAKKPKRGKPAIPCKKCNLGKKDSKYHGALWSRDGCSYPVVYAEGGTLSRDGCV